MFFDSNINRLFTRIGKGSWAIPATLILSAVNFIGVSFGQPEKDKKPDQLVTQKDSKSRLEDDDAADAAAANIGNLDKDIKTEEVKRDNFPSNSEQRQHSEQKIAEEKKEADQLVDKFPDSPKVQIEGTKFALNRGDNQTALNRAERVIELEPKRGSGYAYAAEANDKLGRKDKALADAKEALKYDPNSKIANAIKNLYDGRVPVVAPDLPKALSSIRGPTADADATRPGGPSQEPPPTTPSAAQRLAEKGQAVANQQKADEFTAQAELKLKLKDYNEAFDQANRAINLDPKDARARLARVRALNGRKNFDGAVSDADFILKGDPNNAAALVERSYAMYHLGRYEEAQKDATNAILLDSNNALAYYNRAQAEEKLGLAQEAKNDYRKAAALDPALAQTPEQAPAPLKPAKTEIPKAWIVKGGGGLGVLLLLLFGLSLLKDAAKRPPRPATPQPRQARPRYATLPSRMVLGENFRIIREVGRGGMGVVYEAEDLTLNRRVAIKQLYRDRHVMQEDLECFVAEARLVAKLKHPNIAEIHQVVEADDLYLVFEFLDGGTLADLIEERRGLSLPEVAQVARGVAAAVGFAHSQNVIHRDLKPGNIMLTREGTPKVTDFGLAHQATGAKSESMTLPAGTLPYMAPEQHMGAARKESDLYSLGLMLYEMLTGELPFKGPDYLGEKQRFSEAGITKRNSALPAALDAFFQRALQADPTQRWPSAGEFIAAFEKAAQV